MRKTLIVLNAICALFMVGYWFDMDWTYYFDDDLSLIMILITSLGSIAYLCGITEFSMLFDRLKNNWLVLFLQRKTLEEQQKIKTLKDKS